VQRSVRTEWAGIRLARRCSMITAAPRRSSCLIGPSALRRSSATSCQARPWLVDLAAHTTMTCRWLVAGESWRMTLRDAAWIPAAAGHLQGRQGA